MNPTLSTSVPVRKPPRNYRGVELPRLCVNCALLTTDADKTFCIRRNGPVYETGDHEEWFNVCDGWRSFAKAANHV